MYTLYIYACMYIYTYVFSVYWYRNPLPGERKPVPQERHGPGWSAPEEGEGVHVKSGQGAS